MKKAFFVLILAFQLAALAQSPSSGIKVEVFDHKDTAKQAEKVRPLHWNGPKNAITFNALLFVRGFWGLGYERALGTNHSINVNLGVTFRDVAFEIYTGGKREFFDIKATKVIPHLCFDLNYKYWPNHYSGFSGLYLSGGLAYKKFETYLDYQNNVGQDNIDFSKVTERPFHYTLSEQYVKFGYVYDKFGIKNWAADYYCGLGLMHVNLIYNTIETASSLGQMTTVSLEEKSESFYMPSFYLGTRLLITF